MSSRRCAECITPSDYNQQQDDALFDRDEGQPLPEILPR